MSAAESPRRRHLVSTDWLAANMGDPALRVYECTVILTPRADNSGQIATSGRAGWEAGHIAESAFLDLSDDFCDRTSPLRFVVPPPDVFAEGAGRLGIGDDTTVVLYDRATGQWAARAWWMLRGFGFDNVRVLDGGLTKWQLEGRPLSIAQTRYPPRTFTPRPRQGVFAGKEDVAAAISDPGVLIVNALSAEQHRGEGGVHYGRKGRITGSVNVPARSLTDPREQTYLPDDQLRQRLAEAGDLDGKRIIAYCGGGIAASNLALALALVGIDDVSIYTNSLQEWANDPACPMEVD